MPPTGRKAVSCPVETTLIVIGGRWKVMVLHYLFEGTLRFAELHRKLPGISHRTLTKQFRELETAGVIHREVYPEVPPRVEYSLKPLGLKLRPVLMSMHRWGEEYERRHRPPK